MTDWPTLTSKPLIAGYSVYTNDPTLRSQTHDGLDLARPGCEELVHFVEFSLRKISSADKSTLDTFQNTTIKIGAYPFNFTETIGNVTYVVRLQEQIKFELEADGVNWRTKAPIRLKEDG
jgi:hypothetical protein